MLDFMRFADRLPQDCALDLTDQFSVSLNIWVFCWIFLFMGVAKCAKMKCI